MNKSIKVTINDQMLYAYEQHTLVMQFDISTAAKGIGQQYGSMQTPLGEHIIRAKIGTGMPVGTVFRGRRPTGECYSPALAAAQPQRDWIITRILWLSGCEKGFNRLGKVDTMRRYIYIHGSPEEKFASKPFTHGCIGVRNDDMLRLFDWVEAYTRLRIMP